MTRQEQIEEMAKIVDEMYNVYTTTADDIADGLYNAGYRKVPCGAVVLTPEERDDEMKATNEILAERDDLIAKVGILGRENYDLKAENRQLKTECTLLDDELRIARQDTIDVLNKLKSKCHNYYPSIDHYCCSVKAVNLSDIDEIIKEYV